MSRPRKVDSQIIVTCTHAILKNLFIIYYHVKYSIFNTVNAKNVFLHSIQLSKKKLAKPT